MRSFGILVFIAIAFAGIKPAFLHAQDRPNYSVDTARHLSSGCEKERVYAYFQVKGKYPESSQSLAGRAETRLSASKIYGDANGHVTFQVQIDCTGKLAGVKLLQTNTRYEPCFFPKGLVDELYAFLLSLKEWKQVKAEGRPVNYSGYLSFKLEGGHVVQVSP